MPLVSLNEVYADANENWYAIGQFNFSNLEFAQAVLEAAVEMNSPVILAASSSAMQLLACPPMLVKPPPTYTVELPTAIVPILLLGPGSQADNERSAAKCARPDRGVPLT